MGIVIGCDFHSRAQQLVVFDETDKSRRAVRLEHADRAQLEAFYRALPADTVVLIETTAFSQWFTDLLLGMGLRLKVGDAARLAAMRTKKQKTDRRDAEHLLDMYLQGAFPEVTVPGPRQRELRHLLQHRDRMVRIRTRVRNCLHGLAMSYGINRKQGLFTRKGRQQLMALALDRWEAVGRGDLLLLHDQVQLRIDELDQEVERQAQADPLAERLMTHPGVGPVTALAWVQIMGDCGRFATSAQAASYLGLVPSEASSGERRRLGAITKQGNQFMRWLLVEAVQTTVRLDPQMIRQYRRMALRKHRSIAKVAMARKLAERMYWMCRRGVGYPRVMVR